MHKLAPTSLGTFQATDLRVKNTFSMLILWQKTPHKLVICLLKTFFPNDQVYGVLHHVIRSV